MLSQGRRLDLGFNTQPPEGGWADKDAVIYPPYWFQHTAARRRLVLLFSASCTPCSSFNTQPPEGGWRIIICMMG